jgi:Na+/melibiose symporter-like transporter
MFNLCITCENSPEWARFIYYAPFVVIFQFGWASTQISHLSLIPQLTKNENEKVALNAIRYSFTVASNLFIYGATFFLLKFDDPNIDDDLTRKDAPKFM